MTTERHTLPRSTWGMLALLTLGWGFNWPMMKISLADIPVLTFRSLCILAGAAGLFGFARYAGHPLLPKRDEWPRLAGTALLNVTGWNLLIAYGLMLLPAGRAVILAYTMPLWVALLSLPILGERLTSRRVLGVALGMSGMLLLLGSELNKLSVAPTGALLVIGAALSWALGTVLIKRFPTNLPASSFTAWQLLLGGIPIVIGCLMFDPDKWHWPGNPALIGLVYNMLVAFILCHWAWFEIVNRASASVSSLGTLLIPIVGVFSSLVVLHESASWTEYAALALVLSAIATVIIPTRALRTT